MDTIIIDFILPTRKITTFNIAGVCSEYKQERMENMNIDSDIIALQEVDFNIIPKFIKKYKFHTKTEEK